MCNATTPFSVSTIWPARNGWPTPRPEGVRLKHYASGNSIKIYDKHGQVLRVETTLNHPEAFRVYRTPEGQPHRLKRWRPLRKAVADLPRRAQICRAANDRYIAA